MLNKLEYKYQPIVDLHSFKVVRQEALLRTKITDRIEGLIETMEENGSIIELDLHTLATAVAQLNETPSTPVAIAVNMSAQSLGCPTFQDKAMSLLRSCNNAGLISVEITEKSAIQNQLFASLFVRRLKQQGCTIGMDDYGDGFSTLALAESMKVNYLKLSSKLTTRVLVCEDAQESIREAIRVAGVLGIKIVAEHVDNAEQFVWLRNEGIAHGQGWLFAKAGELITCPNDFTSDLRKRLGEVVNNTPRRGRCAKHFMESAFGFS